MAEDADNKEQAKYKHWADEIESAKKAFEAWAKRCRKILKTYKDERKHGDDDTPGVSRGGAKMNILWSNIQTLQPALYSRTPVPNASRRFLDRDPVSRTAAMIMERNLVTAIELADLDYSLRRVRDDYLLCARGTNWVRFDPLIGKAPMKEPVTAIDLGGRKVYRPFKGGEEIAPDKVKSDGDGFEYYETDPEEQILAYGLACDHVLWSDFLHEPVNDWSKVTWAAKRVLMRRKKLIKHFGEEVGRKVTLNKTFGGDKADDISTDSKRKGDSAEVWEIWCKDSRTVYWISDGYEEGCLKEEKDPLNLQSFWPFPRPMFGTTTTDSLIPVPDYAIYQDQSEQIDSITDRIRLLINALRVVGLYNGESADLSTLLGETAENEMIPVANWMSFSQTGGMKGNIDWLPIEQIQAVLLGLFNARTQLKQDLYEVTGMSDIIRGASNPNETATAQQIKSNFGNLRLQDRQAEMSRFAKDTLKIMSEIQCEHYSAQALIDMSGVADMEDFRVEPPKTQDPQAMADYQAKQQAAQKKLMDAVQLIKNDRMRTFRIDLETDATVAPDQQKEKEARVEFLTAVAPFIEKATQVGQIAPDMVPLLLKMLEFGVRGFRAGRSLEGAIEETIALAEQMQEQAKAAGPQQPPPDPAAEAMKAKLEAETQKIQQELAQAQADAQTKQAENAAKMQAASEKAQRDAQLFQEQILKLTEDIQFRREENRLKIAELQASIELKKVQMQQATEQDALKQIQQMMPQESPPLDPLADAKLIAEEHELKARQAKAQRELAEAEMSLREMQERGQTMESLKFALQQQSTKQPAAPAAPSRKSVLFNRDENGVISGADIEG